MNKVSQRHLNLISFLKSGGAIEVCTSFGRSLGDIQFPNGQPEGFSKATLSTLFARGYLAEREVQYYGLRFSRLTYQEPVNPPKPLIGEG